MTEASSRPEERKGDYKPIFPKIINNFKTFMESKLPNLKFLFSESMTEHPSIAINNISSRLIEPAQGGYSYNQMLKYEGYMQIVLYVDSSKLEDTYDHFMNALFAWKEFNRLIGLNVVNKEIYPTPNMADFYRIYMGIKFMYIDYVADTSFPVIEERTCFPDDPSSCMDLRVKSVQVTDYGREDVSFVPNASI